MNQWQQKALTFGWGLVVLVFAVGCNSSGPDIKGTVTLDGKPLGRARIDFEPINAPPGTGGNVAFCDENGGFTLVPQAEGRTLKPATYGVLVSLKKDAQGKVPSQEDYGQLDAAGQLQESVPAKYVARLPDGSYTLKVDIKDGPTAPLKFDLLSQ